jgi:Fic family protein
MIRLSYMNDTNITSRQKLILNTINKSDGLGRKKIQELIKGIYKVSKPTLIRDLNIFIKRGLIKQKGEGKNTKYFPYFKNPLLKLFDLGVYFAKELDERVGAKKSFDFSCFNFLTVNQLHNILVKDLNIAAGIRDQAVGITGTVYRSLANKFQIREALEKLINKVNKNSKPLEKALIVGFMIPYIQPFFDANKRTARMLSNALLLAYDFYPLSYRSVDEQEFQKALIFFYEQQSVFGFKKDFISQLIFAYNTYFK